MLKIFWSLCNLVLHISAVAAIYYFWKPISGWFLAKIPALGVDLYLSATYVSYQLRNFSLPFNSFKDFWFGGYPLARDYPQLIFYLMMPFANWYGPVEGVRRFTMFALLFMGIACYFLFYKLAKNQGIALFLAVAVLLSPNIYGAATWAGSIPYFFSQVTYPLGLAAGVVYLKRPSLRTLALMVLVTAFGFLINPFGILAFLIPSLFLIILFAGISESLSFKRIFSHFIFYNLGVLFGTFIFTYDQVIVAFTQFVLPTLPIGTGGGGSAAAAAGSVEIAQFYKNQITLLQTRTEPWIFIILIAGILPFLTAFLFGKEKRSFFKILPFVLIVAWAAAHPIINLGGYYNILRHDPYRAFWQFPVAVGALAAALWGFSLATLWEKVQARVYLLLIYGAVSIVLTLGVAYWGYLQLLPKIEKTIEVVETNSEYSSAFPEALSINFKKEDLSELKKQNIPSFINQNEKNFRLYAADATVNIWWNALFDVPLARGYIDPPIGTQSRGGFFWLDIAIANDTLVRDFKLSEEVALANALFLIDWNAIGFFEGGRISSKGPAVGPSTYLVNNQVFDKEEETTTYGAILKYQTASGKPELVSDLPQKLHYYKVADNYRSPILYPTNAAAVVVVTSDPQYEDMMRILATKNLNSKNVIPSRVDYIDDLTLEKLKAFDGVILQKYHYKNREKSFVLLERYVKEGGKVFIDTGDEVRESIDQNLPEIFPFDSSERKSFGSEWKLAGDSKFLKDVNLVNFGPLIFNDSDWKLTVPEGNLRDGSKVLLSHDGKPILVERSIGRGKVIWSGMNLSYHFNQYKSQDEADMFIKILASFTSLDEQAPLPAKTHWTSSEKVTIETDTHPRGIMFKEEGYDGWTAKVDGKRLPIYKTGPTFPGFMYVPLTDIGSGPIKIQFSYNGTFSYWVVTFVNVVAIFILLDVFLGSWFNKRAVTISEKLLGRRVLGWWSKEDE